MALKGKHFLKLLDFTPAQITGLLDLAADLKAKKKAAKGRRILSFLLTALLAIGLFQITAPVRQAEAAVTDAPASCWAEE